MASHCESSPGSFDECRLSAGWPPTSNQASTIAILLLLSPKADAHFTVPRRVERLSRPRPRHCSKGVQPVPKAVYRSGEIAEFAELKFAGLENDGQENDGK